MKTSAVFTQLAVLGSMMILGLGCAEKMNNATPTPTTIIGGPTTTIAPSGTGSKTVAWQPVSIAELNTYVMLHPVNAPYNYRLTVDLQNIGNGRYAGSIRVGYYDNGQYYEADFQSGFGYNQISYQGIDTGKPEAEFNQWFMFGGKRVFHGFFQDQYGAVMLVINNGIDLGDGGGLTIVSGEIWYKNFDRVLGSQSSEKCWFHTPQLNNGDNNPYSCRTFIDGNGHVQTTSALYPTNGYRKLGTFTGLDKPAAFNE